MKKTDIAAAAIELGYQLQRCANHYVWKHAITGAVVVTAKSASDHRALKNAKRYLMRGALA
jgi:hypothetical protein